MQNQTVLGSMVYIQGISDGLLRKKVESMVFKNMVYPEDGSMFDWYGYNSISTYSSLKFKHL